MKESVLSDPTQGRKNKKEIFQYVLVYFFGWEKKLFYSISQIHCTGEGQQWAVLGWCLLECGLTHIPSMGTEELNICLEQQQQKNQQQNIFPGFKAQHNIISKWMRSKR